MKTLAQVDWDAVSYGIERPVKIITSRLVDDRELDVVFSRSLNMREACLALFRAYTQLAGEYPCTNKSGRNYSITLRSDGKSATFASHPVQRFGLPLSDHNTHYRFILVDGEGSLARPIALEIA